MEVRGARVAPMFLRDVEVGSCSSWIVVMPADNWPPGIGEGGVRVINDDVVRTAHITPDELAEVEAREWEVLESRAQRYRGGREPIGLEGCTVLMVDDGPQRPITPAAGAGSGDGPGGVGMERELS
ncbi:hypothetical protein ACFTXM_23470 [Streptomyces sp. NPDC056930]|uniref:hypothetical protein n=1 Tax=Streptomyces sp. NPDC056930 TaxID=3345967 RepID=UPI00362CD3BC